MRAILAGAPGPELTSDERFAGRVRRLVGVSSTALGFITILAIGDGASGPMTALFGLGWLTMPVLLAASLSRPRIRYLLGVPATAVGIAATWMLASGTADAGGHVAGWLLIACGVWIGALLGTWFWYRWLPVPGVFDDPFSPGRWLLVAGHAGAVTAGIVLVLL